MMELTQVHGKKLAMVAWGKKTDGGDDVVVFTGMANWDGRRLRMLREGGEIFEVPEELWGRIRETNAEVREIVLGAEFCFSVVVGDVEDARGMERTGLKWPSD